MLLTCSNLVEIFFEMFKLNYFKFNFNFEIILKIQFTLFSSKVKIFLSGGYKQNAPFVRRQARVWKAPSGKNKTTKIRRKKKIHSSNSSPILKEKENSVVSCLRHSNPKTTLSNVGKFIWIGEMKCFTPLFHPKKVLCA